MFSILADHGLSASHIAVGTRGLIAVASAYEGNFDESYRAEVDDAIIVAGYVGHPDQWARLIEDWHRTLTEKDLKYFHAKEFRSEESTHYKHLSEDDRKDLVRKLIGSIRARMNFGIIVEVHEAEYESKTSQRLRSQWGAAYTFAGLSAVMIASNQADDNPDISCVNYVFEEGHRNSAQLLERLRQISVDPYLKPAYGIGTYGLGAKIDSYPLQAADMLAYSANEQRLNVQREPTIFEHLVRPSWEPGLPYMWARPDSPDNAIIDSWIEERREHIQYHREANCSRNALEKAMRLARPD